MGAGAGRGGVGQGPGALQVDESLLLLSGGGPRGEEAGGAWRPR